MTTIYCGNNAANTELTSGNSILGTRYSCLKKGIGRGMNMPPDPTYTGPYIPIDNRKMYCGANTQLPDEYDYMGNLPHCLQKGIGVGKKLVSGFIGFTTTNRIAPVASFVLIAITAFLILYFTKPLFLRKKNINNKVMINWGKFMGIYIAFLTILGFFTIVWFNKI